MGIRAPTERGSEIPQGTLGWGYRRYARGRLRGYAVHRHTASKGCLLTFRQPLAMQRVRLGRCIDVATRGRSAHPSPRGCTSTPPDPTPREIGASHLRIRQASAEHLKQRAEPPSLCNRSLGPLAVAVSPIPARQEGRRYPLRRQLAATVDRHMAVQTRRTKLRQPEFRPFHFFDTRLLLATIYLN
jgi:hypothetical protein